MGAESLNSEEASWLINTLEHTLGLVRCKGSDLYLVET